MRCLIRMAALTSSNEPWLEVTTSRGFAGWLADQQVSLAFTTYQNDNGLLVGRVSQWPASGPERTFDRCMGPGTHSHCSS
jgi:hypothetical protein